MNIHNDKPTEQFLLIPVRNINEFLKNSIIFFVCVEILSPPLCFMQELALQRGWRLPEYTVLRETGPPHIREFTVTCRLESLSEKGMSIYKRKNPCVLQFFLSPKVVFCVAAAGNSKKAAKKAAAEKMMAKLQSLSGCSEVTWVSGDSVLCRNISAPLFRKRFFLHCLLIS